MKHKREEANMIKVEVTVQQEAGPPATPEMTATQRAKKPAPVPGTNSSIERSQQQKNPFLPPLFLRLQPEQ